MPGKRLPKPLERKALAAAGVDPIIAQLRAARLAREISQTEIAELLGLEKHAQFSVLERGHRNPRLDSLRKWADVLGFDLALVPRSVVEPVAVEGREP